MNLNLTQFKTLKTGFTTSWFHFLEEKEKKKKDNRSSFSTFGSLQTAVLKY